MNKKWKGNLVQWYHPLLKISIAPKFDSCQWDFLYPFIILFSEASIVITDGLGMYGGNCPRNRENPKGLVQILLILSIVLWNYLISLHWLGFLDRFWLQWIKNDWIDNTRGFQENSSLAMGPIESSKDEMMSRFQFHCLPNSTLLIPLHLTTTILGNLWRNKSSYPMMSFSTSTSNRVDG